MADTPIWPTRHVIYSNDAVLWHGMGEEGWTPQSPKPLIILGRQDWQQAQAQQVIIQTPAEALALAGYLIQAVKLATATALTPASAEVSTLQALQAQATTLEKQSGPTSQS